MRAGLARAQDVDHLPAANREVIGKQHAVAAPVETLGAHVSGGAGFGQAHQFAGGCVELGGAHVVGVIAEAGHAQPSVQAPPRISLTRPPASVTISMPAATSQGFRLISQKASRRPQAT